MERSPVQSHMVGNCWFLHRAVQRSREQTSGCPGSQGQTDAYPTAASVRFRQLECARTRAWLGGRGRSARSQAWRAASSRGSEGLRRLPSLVEDAHVSSAERTACNSCSSSVVAPLHASLTPGRAALNPQSNHYAPCVDQSLICASVCFAEFPLQIFRHPSE